MNPSIRVDMNGLRRQVQTMDQNRKAARIAAGQVGVQGFVGHIEQRAPRDTNRYIASVVQAGQDVGVMAFNRPPIVAGRRREVFLDRLQDQALFWRGRAEKLDASIGRIKGMLERWGYTNGGRKATKWSRAKLRQINKLEKDSARAWERAGRATEELIKAMGDQSFILMHGSRGRMNKRGTRVIGQRLTTVRVKVYGGHGEMIITPDQTLIRMVSKEPHSVFVERRLKLFSSAIQAVRSLGVARIRPAYYGRVAAGTTLMVKGSVGGSLGGGGV